MLKFRLLVVALAAWAWSGSVQAGITVFEARGVVTGFSHNGQPWLNDFRAAAPFGIGDDFIITYAFNDAAPDLFPNDPSNGLRSVPTNRSYVVLSTVRVRIGSFDQTSAVTNSGIGIYQDRIVSTHVQDEYHVSGLLDNSQHTNPFGNGFRLYAAVVYALGEVTHPGTPNMLLQGDDLFTDPAMINLAAANRYRILKAYFERSNHSHTVIVEGSFDSLSLSSLEAIGAQTPDEGSIPTPATVAVLLLGLGFMVRRGRFV
jgi:hypothetical protein